MAMINIALVALFALLATSVHGYKFLFGGATSIQSLANVVVGSFKGAGTYQAVGSGAGIAGFLNGTYAIGASDDPLSDTQDKAANKFGKLTIPVVLATYSFVTKKARSLTISPEIAGSMYLAGGVSSWSSIKAGLSGSIVPVGRSDGSGTTKLISIWISRHVANWPAAAVGTATFCGKAGFKSTIVCAKGTGGVVSVIAGDVNAIGYVQTGQGIAGGLYETAAKNPAGKFVFATKADPTQSIPRTLPNTFGNWAGVSLLDKSGAGTYPIASFEYTFARKTGGPVVKSFMLYTMSSAVQNIVTKYYFFRLPVQIVLKNNNSIKTIK